MTDDSSILPTLVASATADSAAPPARTKRNNRILRVLLGILLLMLMVSIGSAPREVYALITPRVVVAVVAQHLPFVGKHVSLPTGTIDKASDIVWDNRLPRALVGACVGLLLALAGVTFQSLLMNPLADPYTTGVASGSALGTIALSMAGGAAWLGGYALIGSAFASGLLAVSIVYLMARVNGRVSAQTFLLSGTIVGSFFFALVPLLLSRAGSSAPEQRAVVMSALFGSLNTVGWPQFQMLLPFCLIGSALLWLWSGELDMMTNGEESATHLGVDTEAFKRRVILLGSLLTAAAVSVAGIIAFVGFLVPHLARRLVSPNHRALVPASALLGSFVLVLADCLSRVLLNDLAIGVITSLMGVPFFCALLRRRMVQS